MATMTHKNGGVEEGLQQASEADKSTVWTVGDLIRDQTNGQRMLILAVGLGWTAYILETGEYGRFFGEGRDDQYAKRTHNTGLTYNFIDAAQVKHEFSQSVFNPYFDIL